jgi:hypothetical protein
MHLVSHDEIDGLNQACNAPATGLCRPSLTLKNYDGISEFKKPGLTPEIQSLTLEEVLQVEDTFKLIDAAYQDEMEKTNQKSKILLDFMKWPAKSYDCCVRGGINFARPTQ